MMVLLAAICCIIPPKPQTNNTISDNHRIRDVPNKIRPTPKAAVEIGIILPNPRTVFRRASEIADTNAPMPTAPIRKAERMRPAL